MKCLWKVVKLFPGWEAEIDFDMVLYDIHLFLKVSTVSHMKIICLQISYISSICEHLAFLPSFHREWYNNDPRTLPWGTPALTDDNSVYSVSTFTRKCLIIQRGRPS
jgi:hypothetical protein